jgi:hypothetical protein
MTQTAIDHGFACRREASQFLDMLRDNTVYDQINGALVDEHVSAADRLMTVRSLTRLQARNFLAGRFEQGEIP